MQHWHEPKPLGEAQRVGMMQMQQQQAQQGALQSQHEAAIRQQIARQHGQAMRARRPGGIFHTVQQGLGSVSSALGGGFGGLLVGTMLGYWIGSTTSRRSMTRRLGEQRLAGVAGNPDEDEGLEKCPGCGFEMYLDEESGQCPACDEGEDDGDVEAEDEDEDDED
jgi:hypothetical protein